MQNSARFQTISDFDREYLRNGTRYPKSERNVITTDSSRVPWKSRMIFGPLTTENGAYSVILNHLQFDSHFFLFSTANLSLDLAVHARTAVHHVWSVIVRAVFLVMLSTRFQLRRISLQVCARKTRKPSCRRQTARRLWKVCTVYVIAVGL